MMSNAGAASLSLRHNLRGPVFGIVSACAAGSHAIGTALRMIQCGDADAVVTGGAEASLTPLARAAFASMSALSPTGVSRPFDARRDGFVMGEGAGVLVLEDEELALARGARILGRARGLRHHGRRAPPHGARRRGARRRAAPSRLALRDAGYAPSDVDYVNAHGTSTPLNDRAETMAIKLALGERAATVPVSSTKSAIGHLLGAAGAVEAVATVLALRDRVAPPDPRLGGGGGGPRPRLRPRPRPPARHAEDAGPAVGLSNSFGFGGHNVALCLEAA